MIISVKDDNGIEVFTYDTKRQIAVSGSKEMEVVSALRDALRHVHDLLLTTKGRSDGNAANPF